MAMAGSAWAQASMSGCVGLEDTVRRLLRAQCRRGHTCHRQSDLGTGGGGH